MSDAVMPEVNEQNIRDVASEHDVEPYILKSEKLKYVGTKLYYSRAPDKPICLCGYYIPVSSTSPLLKRLSDNVVYTNTALALCDDVIRRSKIGLPTHQTLKQTLTRYWNTMLFLRNRGVYSLQEATKDDIIALCKEFSKGGWTGALEVEEKVSTTIANMTREDLKNSVHFYGSTAESRSYIDSLRAIFWRPKIGFDSPYLLNKKTKKAFEDKAQQFGYLFIEKWQNRYLSEQEMPSGNVYRTLLSFFNQLFHLPKAVDKLNFLPFENTAYWAKKFATRPSERTENLGIDEASHMLGKALDWVYDYGERLVAILEECRDRYPKNHHKFLLNENPFEQLAKDLGIPTPNRWNMHMHPHKRPDYRMSVNELVGATLGACAVVIAGFNARRSSEVCDDEVGLREIDFLLDLELDVHKVNFYIEKTYRERHGFYVNKATSDAIRLLIRLKKASHPFDEEYSHSESLFRGNNWTNTGPSKTAISFTFSRANEQTRSLTSFLNFLDPDFKDIDIKSHMWRRFFSLIYIYRYSHSTLQSLSQHLRHIAIHRTIVYVTDPPARAQTERISHKVPNSNQSKTMDLQLVKALCSDNEELEEAISYVQKEKFSETVASILNADRHSGGFPRLIRKLYKSFSSQLTFGALSETEQCSAISATLLSRGYTCNPMPHGQCNAPADSFTYSGKCSTNGRLKLEKASAVFCQNCMFHSKDDSFIRNLKEEIIFLEEDIQCVDTPDIIRTEAIVARKNLLDVIEIHDHAANMNAIAMQKAFEKNE